MSSDDGPGGTRHVSVWIDAAWEAVYAFASDERNLSEWAAGLDDPQLAAEVVEFVPTNTLGVLDHIVGLPDGRKVYNPMRVIPTLAGEYRCEVVFTVRRQPDQTDDQFDADAAAVTEDLATLKRLMER